MPDGGEQVQAQDKCAPSQEPFGHSGQPLDVWPPLPLHAAAAQMVVVVVVEEGERKGVCGGGGGKDRPRTKATQLTHRYTRGTGCAPTLALNSEGLGPTARALLLNAPALAPAVPALLLRDVDSAPLPRAAKKAIAEQVWAGRGQRGNGAGGG